MTLGEQIQTLRRKAGYSQEALGEMLGVTRQSISKWESDQAIPEVEKLIALSRLFQVPVGVLLQVEKPCAPAPEKGARKGGTACRVRQKIRPAAWAAAVIVLVLAISQTAGLSARTAQLQEAVLKLEEAGKRQEQIWEALSSRIDKLEEDGPASFTVTLEEADYRMGEAVFSLSAVPESPAEYRRVRFTAVSAQGEQTVQGKMDASGRYSASFTCPLADGLTFYVYFFGDRETQVQKVTTFAYLLNDSIVWNNARAGMDGTPAEADGSFDWEGPIEMELRAAQVQDKTGVLTVELTGLELQFYQNGRPVWGPESVDLTLAGAEGALQAPLHLSLKLKEGDCLHLVGRSTDTLGRSWLEVLDWYKVTQEGGKLRLTVMDPSPFPIQLREEQEYASALPEDWVNPPPA